MQAVHKITALANLTLAVLAAEESNSDALPNFLARNVRINGVDAADDLVPRHSRQNQTGILPFHRCCVGMTYAACFDAEAHLSPALVHESVILPGSAFLVPSLALPRRLLSFIIPSCLAVIMYRLV